MDTRDRGHTSDNRGDHFRLHSDMSIGPKDHRLHTYTFLRHKDIRFREDTSNIRDDHYRLHTYTFLRPKDIRFREDILKYGGDHYRLHFHIPTFPMDLPPVESPFS